MGKRSFRPQRPAKGAARYPLEAEGRRSFLRGLVGLAAGGVALSVLAACGDRKPVNEEDDPHVPPWADSGGAPPMDAGVDQGPEMFVSGGVVDAMPSLLDTAVLPDAEPPPVMLDGALFWDDGEP